MVGFGEVAEMAGPFFFFCHFLVKNGCQMGGAIYLWLEKWVAIGVG